jgi:diguanylate cyclase (GGDEF)-like protein
MRKINPLRLAEALEQLAQAVHEHTDWQEGVLEAIVHGAPFDANEPRDGVQLGCRFNRWYFDRAPAELWGTPAYAAMGVEHRRLHRLADRLLHKFETDAPIDVEEFDELIAGIVRLHDALDALRHGVAEAVRNLDAATGAADRAGMLIDLRAWRDLAVRGVQKCSIVLVDLDGFKAINDAHGRAIGDELLAVVARRLVRLLRPFDKVYRYGADEFLIALPGADLTMAQSMIKQVREGFAGAPLMTTPDGIDLRVTAAFGLASLDPEISAEESLERADQALLLAKTAGGNRAISWDPGVTTGVRLPRLQLDDIQE